MAKVLNTAMTAADAFSAGFDAGNYASAYVDNDCETAWEVSEDGEQFDVYRETEECRQAFREGFLVGFFSSYEEHEVDPEVFEEWAEAVSKHPEALS